MSIIPALERSGFLNIPARAIAVGILFIALRIGPTSSLTSTAVPGANFIGVAGESGRGTAGEGGMGATAVFMGSCGKLGMTGACGCTGGAIGAGIIGIGACGCIAGIAACIN